MKLALFVQKMTSPYIGYSVATNQEPGAKADVTSRTRQQITTMADDESEGLQHATERYNLLVRIKSTVDGLLASNSVNVWSTYGGLARISDDLEHIFKHGLRELQVLI